MTKDQLKEVAKNTLQIIKNKSYKIKNNTINLEEDLKNCLNNTKLYVEDININDIQKSDQKCKFEFTKETTMSAAKRLFDNKGSVCILNFASAKHPGGGFENGSMAQEESIAYISSLYDSLNKFYDDFYAFHLKKCNAFYSDRIIYSKGIIVFKDEKYNLLENPYYINVITSPAVNAGTVINWNNPKETQKINPAMEQRIRKIIKTAIVNGDKTIVLGAFGCGVFKNKIEDVAKIFKKVLITEGYKDYFETIVFAIYDRTGDKALNTFKGKFLY